MHDKNKLFSWLEASRGDMIELQRLLTAVPALAPESGGAGEVAKAAALVAWLKKRGFPAVSVYEALDSRVPRAESGRTW